MPGIQSEYEFSFFYALYYFYNDNRGKVRRTYKDLTRKFLDYNDKSINPNAFLRRPQFEALEMYVFIKEFMDNKQVSEMFDEWNKRTGDFSDSSFYTVDSGQVTLYDTTADESKTLFKQMKKYSEDYPNYIFSLAMGERVIIVMGAVCAIKSRVSGTLNKYISCIA